MSELEHDGSLSSSALQQLHLHRYALACDQVAGLKVLCLGAGEGSGTALLATRALHVTLLDADPSLVSAAKTRLGASPRLQFLTGSFSAMPADADAFDAVVAFDMDWADEPGAVLAEIRRVLTPEGFALLLGPTQSAGGEGSFSAALERVFDHRLALSQRIVAASALSPVDRASSPNTAEYRGYTTAPGAGLMAGVVRMKRPARTVWIVGERSLPRMEGVDSMFLDPAKDLWFEARPPVSPAVAERPAAPGDMSIVAALVEQLLDAPVGHDLASLAKALGQANVRLAVQDVKLADKSRLDAALTAAEQEYRRLADRLEESRSDAAAARTLALESQTQAERLAERLAQATREAEARRQIVDESQEQIQTLALALETTRRESEAASALASQLTEQLEKAGQEAEAGRLQAESLGRDLEASRQEGRLALEELSRLEVELEAARNDAEAARNLASTLDEAVAEALRETQRVHSERDSVSLEAQAALRLADESAGRAEALHRELQAARDAAKATESLAFAKADEAEKALVRYEQARAQSEAFQAELEAARRAALDADLARNDQVARLNATTDELARMEASAAAITAERDGLLSLLEDARLSAEVTSVERDAILAEIEKIQSEAQSLRAELEDVRRNAAVTSAEREVILAEIELTQAEAQSLRAEREAVLSELEAVRVERQTVRAEADALRDTAEAVMSEREVLASELVALKADAARKAVVDDARRARDAAARQGVDPGFAIGLRSRIQHAAVDEVSAYRAGFAAAATIRSAHKELADQLARVSGTAAILPLEPPATVVRTGKMRPASRKAKLRAVFRGQAVSTEPPSAPPEAVAVLFDPDHYMAANAIVLRPGETPFDHYVRSGRRKGYSTHPMIDADWIRSTWPEGSGQPFDLFAYICDARLHDQWPNPLFEGDHYRRMNRDVADAGINPLAHYLIHGWREGRQPNQLFDNDWYLATHTDVLAAGANPLQHYITSGKQELRKPHPLFDHGFYLDRYPDVASSGMDAYAHFIAYGRGEGRFPSGKVMSLHRLESYFDGTSINDLLLGGDPEARLRRLDDDFWPPRPVGEYWLPQRLRDFIIDRYGEGELQLNAWLFSLIERYGDAPETFDASAECDRLIARARLLASTPLTGKPSASIILPVYNNLLYTLTCIVSVLESAPNHSFEILVGDDGSSDRTAEAMAAIGGLVRHIRNPRNLGFLGNCNAAAERATGEYVVFLNNDTIVFPGWLDRLIEAMTADPTIGFIGSKLLNGDGSLQEAGGLFWSDGSAWNFGRNADPMAPEFNYLKDVDYVSGASIALPIKIWRRLGGFDPHFSPAYCEDSDLAFRVRQAGLRSVYHPHSALVHHEGRSHGRDINSGIKAFQVVNGEKFLARWGDTLLRENFPNATEVFLARDRSRDRPHILIVDHYIPKWDQDAGSRTIFLYIKMFIERGFSVTFWADNLHEDRTYAAPLQALGVEVIYSAAYRNAFDRWYGENGHYFDYALLSRPHISENYIKTVATVGRAKIIYYGHDLHFKRLRSAYEVTKDPALLLEADKWEKIEIDVCSLSTVVLYPGHEEVAEVQARVPETVSVLPFPITIFNAQEQALGRVAVDGGHERNPFSLMFVGGFSHDPNVGGILWFVREVMPHLRQADARFHIRIAGSNAPKEVLELECADVTVMGRISDEQLDGLYSSSGFAVVPLLYGGGVKGKVIEAMARGVPVVMTSVGAQGIPDAAVLSYVEDDPKLMAQALISAAMDRADALSRAERALDFIDQFYSTRAVTNLLASAIPELVKNRSSNKAGPLQW